MYKGAKDVWEKKSYKNGNMGKVIFKKYEDKEKITLTFQKYIVKSRCRI